MKLSAFYRLYTFFQTCFDHKIPLDGIGQRGSYEFRRKFKLAVFPKVCSFVSAKNSPGLLWMFCPQ